MCDTQHSHSLNGRHRNRNHLLVTLFLQGPKAKPQRQQSCKTRAEPSYHLTAKQNQRVDLEKKNNDAAEDMRTAGMARGDSPRRTAGPRGGRKRRRRRGRGEAKLGFDPAQGSVGYKGGLWSEGFLPGRWILRVTNARLSRGRPMLRGFPT